MSLSDYKAARKALEKKSDLQLFELLKQNMKIQNTAQLQMDLIQMIMSKRDNK